MKKIYTNNCIQKNIRCAKGTIVWLLFTLIIATGLVAFMLYITNFLKDVKFYSIFLFCFSLIVFLIQSVLFIRCIRFKISFYEDKIVIRMLYKKIMFKYEELTSFGFIRNIISDGLFDFYLHREVDVFYLSNSKIDTCELNKKLNKKFYLDFGILNASVFYIADEPPHINLDKCLRNIYSMMGKHHLSHKDELSADLLK